MKRRSTEFRQKQIVGAVRKLIIAHGGEHLTIKRIAEEVGISQGAIYRHFKSKLEILNFLADEVENILLNDLEKNREIDSTPLESLDAALKSHFSAIQQRRGISFRIIAAIISFGDKGLNKKIFDTLTKYIERIAEKLASGVKAGEVRPDIDLDAAATMLFGTIQGLVNIWALSDCSFNLDDKYNTVWYLFREIIRKR